MRRPQIAWALLSLAVGSTGASAAKLDKIACNDLSAELAAVVAAGARGDMGRGPEWAKANLPPERLANIKRLIELEEQLEFRCGMGHNRIVASPASEGPGKHIGDKAEPPEGPVRKPQVKSNAATPPVEPGPDALKPSPRKAAATAGPSGSPARTVSPASAAIEDAGPAIGPPLAAAPASNPPPAARASATNAPATAPPTAAPSAGPIRTVAPETTAVSAAIENADPAVGPPLAAPPTAKPPPAATARADTAVTPSGTAPPAARKSSRRTSRAGYVSPTEVNPYFVTRYGDSH